LDMEDIGTAAGVAALHARDEEELEIDASSSGTTVSDLAAYRGIKATQSGGASFGVTIGAGVTDRVFYVRAPADNDMLFDVVRGTSNYEALPGQTVWFRVTGSDPNRRRGPAARCRRITNCFLRCPARSRGAKRSACSAGSATRRQT
jgi:hypothetical protein